MERPDFACSTNDDGEPLGFVRFVGEGVVGGDTDDAFHAHLRGLCVCVEHAINE